MSYGFTLFKPKPTEDPLVTARTDFDDEALEPTPEKEVLKNKVVSALIKADPSLQLLTLSDQSYEKFAEFEHISLEEARRKYRQLELSLEGLGIQIEIFDDEAGISVPYWHDNSNAEIVFKKIWKYLGIIQRETGYIVYDPQLDIFLDVNQDYKQALKVYEGTRETIKEKLPVTLGKPLQRKSWWQFWK